MTKYNSKTQIVRELERLKRLLGLKFLNGNKRLEYTQKQKLLIARLKELDLEEGENNES